MPAPSARRLLYCSVRFLDAYGARSSTPCLRGLLAYVFVVHSFQHLSIWSVLVGVADISDNDWRKRLRRASAWLSWLLQEMLASTTPDSSWLLRGGWQRVLLLDGTHFTCPGPQGMVWRVHTAFDLLAGRFTQLHVTDYHVAEHLELFDLHSGDLVVTDSANGLRQRVAFVLKQQADLLVRFTPHNLPLYEENGTRLDVVRWLKGQAAPAGRILSRTVWMCYQDKLAPLRWVAVRLSPEQQAASQRRKKRLASRNQQCIQAETLSSSRMGVAAHHLALVSSGAISKSHACIEQDGISSWCLNE